MSSSADEELNIHITLHATGVSRFFETKARSDKTVGLNVVKSRTEQLPLSCNHRISCDSFNISIGLATQPVAFRQLGSFAAICQLRQLSLAANCQLACSLSARAAHCQWSCEQPASNQWVKLNTFRTPAICQPSFDLSAQLQSDSCI